ncbi:MAG: hypothetical protein WCF85_15550 [Rhodospirillaceae bacterium]
MTAVINNVDHVLIICLSGSPVDPSIHGRNGIENIMFNLAALLLRRGKTVSFAVAAPDHGVVNISEKCNVYHIPVACEQPGPIASAHDYISAATEACLAHFQDHRPDVVASCSVATGIVASGLADRWSIPHMHYMMSAHNTLLLTTAGLPDRNEFIALRPVASLPAVKGDGDATVHHYMIELGNSATEAVSCG